MPHRLANASETPHNGWRYYVKETGTWLPGAGQGAVHYLALAPQIAAHCRIHHLPIPERAEVEAQMCSNLPSGVCVDEQDQPVYRIGDPIRLTISNVYQGTRTILSWLIGGMQRVDHAEAERRAGICSACVENQPVEGCTGCSGGALRDLAAQFVAGGSTSYEDRLQGCRICGCGLKAIIWMPLEPLHQHTPADQNEALPAHCWKKKTVTVV